MLFYLRHLLSSTFLEMFFSKNCFSENSFLKNTYFERRRVSFTPTKRCWCKRNAMPRKKSVFKKLFF